MRPSAVCSALYGVRNKMLWESVVRSLSGCCTRLASRVIVWAAEYFIAAETLRNCSACMSRCTHADSKFNHPFETACRKRHIPRDIAGLACTYAHNLSPTAPSHSAEGRCVKVSRATFPSARCVWAEAAKPLAAEAKRRHIKNATSLQTCVAKEWVRACIPLLDKS